VRSDDDVACIFKLLLPHFAGDIDVRTIKERAPCDPEFE